MQEKGDARRLRSAQTGKDSDRGRSILFDPGGIVSIVVRLARHGTVGAKVRNKQLASKWVRGSTRHLDRMNCNAVSEHNP